MKPNKRLPNVITYRIGLKKGTILQAPHKAAEDLPKMNAIVKTKKNFINWTVWSYYDVVFGLLFAIGSIFLLVDMAAVYRDRFLYEMPPYHLYYVYFGFIFLIVAFVLTWLRMARLLHLNKSYQAIAENKSNKPDQAEQSEEGV